WMRFGGVKNDIPDGFLSKVDRFIHYLKDRMPEYADLLQNNEIFQARTKGIGILEPDHALELGCSGPLLRGSGVARDIRMDEPYEIYDKVEFKVVTYKDNDTYSRYMVRYDEIYQSIRIVEQILSSIPDGPVMAKVPKVIKPPKGEVYTRVEAPIGELGIYLVSDGTTKPYRLKIRAPSFSNIRAVPDIIKGIQIPDVIATFASIAPTMGEADR
ncbi:MAG: NADH-quinone oxidoreductase subunit D, partial [Caldisericia bacterium]|nr:NADH-quinone oxidoreductase subunit D [Caldisericia bacterium]